MIPSREGLSDKYLVKHIKLFAVSAHRTGTRVGTILILVSEKLRLTHIFSLEFLEVFV